MIYVLTLHILLGHPGPAVYTATTLIQPNLNSASFEQPPFASYLFQTPNAPLARRSVLTLEVPFHEDLENAQKLILVNGFNWKII